MKKLLLLSLVLLWVLFTNAQVELKGIIGLNFSSFNNTSADTEAKVGYQFGGGLLFGEKFYVEPSIQFVRNSTTFISSGSSTGDIDFSQNFVKIPVHFGYHLLGAEDQPLALRIFAGPSASIAGKIKKGEDQISKDDINNMIWAGDAGLGLDILFLFVEASYEFSFSDYFAEAEGKHWGFIINAGVHFDF